MLKFCFIIFVYISFLIERSTIKCKHKSLYTRFISLIHHIFSVYLYFGTFIFDMYLFNIIIGILTIIGWIVFENRCFLTVYYNKLCGIPKDIQFHDIINFINKFLQLRDLHYYILTLIFFFLII